MHNLFTTDPHFGRIALPPALAKALAPISLPGRPVRSSRAGELGVVVALQKRPIADERGNLLRFLPVWMSISHNERTDAGASYQSRQVHGGGATPGAPGAIFNVIAIASATLTKAKGNQSLGVAGAGVTTNEFTTLGLARATADAPVAGDYTLPATYGGQFTQVIRRTFTATGNATALGAGIFNSLTVAGSVLYIEDNFPSSAVLVANDTLTVQASIQN